MPDSYTPIFPDPNTTPEIVTVKDIADFVLLHGAIDDLTPRNRQLAITAAIDAYQWLVNRHPWKWFNRTCKIAMSPPVSGVAVEYTEELGSFLIAVADTPSWYLDASIQILSGEHRGEYEIMRGEIVGDNYLLYVRPGQRLGADFEGTVRIVRRRYPLPIDFGAERTVYDMKHHRQLFRFQAAEENVSGPWSRETPSEPIQYRVGRSSSPLRKAIEVTPPPSSASILSINYRSRGRPILTPYTQVRVTGSEGSNSVTTDAALPAHLIGTVLRTRDNGDQEIPTSSAGPHPWVMQRVIAEGDGTNWILDQPLSFSLDDQQVVLSDPLDMDPEVILPALRKRAMYEWALHFRSGDDARITEREVRQALTEAREADSHATYSQGRVYVDPFPTIDGGYDQWAVS